MNTPAPTPEQPLDGKVAIITGASSGIGRACAERLHAAGMRIVLVARRADRLAGLIEALGDERVAALTADITDSATATRMFELAQERFGRADVVLNNAAAFAVGAIEKLDADRVCELARTNVEAAYRVAFETVKRFKAQGSGDLVNLSSIAGTKIIRAGIGWYGGTKHAIEALTESLRMECADSGVRVCCIEPGMTQTEIFPEPITSISRPLDAADVARTIEFVLASPPHVSIPRLMILPSAQAI